jgi:hypothetical protein
MSLLLAVPASGAPRYGKLSGMVVDPTGTPQMGATVRLIPENVRGRGPIQLLTNEQGLFTTDRLFPGLYSVHVTLAGFLPAIEQHVRIDPRVTTTLRIELDSLLSSLDRLRGRPNQTVEPDEWMWVLRTSSATRPVLRWVEGEVVLEDETPQAEMAPTRKPRGQVEFTSGARRPGSVANLADAPATTFAYEQKIGTLSRLVLAGQASYERSAAAGFATIWLPSGEPGSGPETTLVLRQSKLGPAGPTFRGVRLQHVNQLALGDRFSLRYGVEYTLMGLGRSTSSLRPRGELSFRGSPAWRGSLSVAACPWSRARAPASALQASLDELDAFPAVLVRNARPVMEGGWHEELSVERQLGSGTSLVAAAFRDHSRHTAVFGRGATFNPEVFQDFFSHVFVYDGGSLNSWGTRIAYRQKFSDELEAAVVYAWAGALVAEDAAATVDLRDALQTRYSHSLAARVAARVPRFGTRLAASYKWQRSASVSRQDAFGELLYQVDPNLNLSFRQPLPTLLFSRRFEALADFGNLLAQGYVPVTARDGKLLLVPAYRSFRGGLSFQF